MGETQAPASTAGRPVRVPLSELGAVAAVAVAYVAVLAARIDPLVPGHPKWDLPYDHHKYLAMADAPFELRLAPFSWRILEPLLVHLSPLGTATTFRLLAAVSVVGTAVAVHVLLRHLGFRRLLAATGTLLFGSLGWVTGYPLSNIWLPDALAALVVVAAAVAAVDRRALRFALLLAVGVLVKEQVLLVAPLWYAFGAERVLDRRLLARTVALTGPALAALVAVRTGLPADNADVAALRELGLKANTWDALPQDPRVLFARFGLPRLPWLPFGVIDYTVGAFGTLGALAFADRDATRRVIVRWSPFLVGVYAQPLLASNTKRLVALAFPVAVIVAVHGLDRLRRHWALPDAAVVAVPVALIVGDLVWRTNVRFAAELVVVGAVLAAGAVAGRRGRRRPDDPPGQTAIGAAPSAAIAASPASRSSPPASTSVRAHW